MMRLAKLFGNNRAAAAAEMALVTPFLLALMFGAVELGNLFMDEHALEKQVRNGARFASRLEMDDNYSCPGVVFADADYNAKVINVTKNGVVDGSGNPRWTGYWSRPCTGGDPTLTVTVRCVGKNQIDLDDTGNSGIYTSLAGSTIPVVSVSGKVKYRSVAGLLGFDATNVCLEAESELPVQGI
jgi:Flp pilus assembly protein TadG